MDIFMKLKKAMILFGTVLILNAMVTGCGSGSESVAKTEEDAISVETDSKQETDKEETANAKTTETESKDVCKCPINTAYSPYTLLWGSIGNANLFMHTL